MKRSADPNILRGCKEDTSTEAVNDMEVLRVAEFRNRGGDTGPAQDILSFLGLCRNAEQAQSRPVVL